MAQQQIGYAAMLEQFHPTELIDYCVAAEEAGFSGVMAADHLQPWVPQQGNAAFVWAFMAAVAERTKGDVGPGVTCPSFRTHPVVIAQAAATLAAMYPGRFWLGLGSGEALNEHIVARYWPEAPERINMMFEAIELFNRLFSGKDTKHDGRFFKMETVRLWTLPDEPPPIYVATAGPITARRTGQFADGLITVGAPGAKLEMIKDKCREGRAESGRDSADFKYILQLHLSWAEIGRAGPGQRHDRVAQRRHEVPQGRYPLATGLRADGQARPARGLRGPDAHLVRSRSASARDPEVRRHGL